VEFCGIAADATAARHYRRVTGLVSAGAGSVEYPNGRRCS